MTSPVFTPLQMFYSTSGLPLTDGYIYIGTASQNPQTNPIAVYWDAAGTIPAAQPIRTSGGYPVRNGSPATVFVLATDFSLIVRDKSSKLVFSRLSGNAFSAEWVTYTAAGTGAVATTAQAKLRESVSVLDFGADPTGVVDSTIAIQAAIDAVIAAGKGTVEVPVGTYLCNTPLVLKDGVNLIGAGRNSTVIRKNSTTTKAVTIVAGALIVYPGVLPSSINAILVLDGTGGRYTGAIQDIAFEGTLATPGNYESQKVEFGIVSVGSVSDFTLERTYISSVQYGLVLPTVFASAIQDNRLSTCLTAVGLDDGTSLTYTSNYANNCRDVGHFIRGVKYSQITNNACDYLNDPAKYPTRTRTCNAYRLRSLVGCSITSNGDEQTWGRSYLMETLDNCNVENNVSIGIGSDYVGTDQIAWLYSDGVLRCSRVVNNVGYSVKVGGLLYGGAIAGQHHNIYFDTVSFVANSEVSGNMVQASLSGSPTEAGWGNNNPSAWVNDVVGGELVQTFSPTITANTVGNLVVTYNSGNKHYRHDLGNLYHVFGCFDVTITYTTAGSFLIFQGFPANQSILWKIPITGVEGGAALAKKLGSFRLNSGGGSGIAFDENDATFAITDIPTGTTLQIFYDGWYAKA